MGKQDIHGCIGCNTCSRTGKCVFDDLVNEVSPKFEQADGLVIGSPVYYGSPNGTLLSFLDRLFYSAQFSAHMKVGAAVVSCRRGGNTASFDVLNKYDDVKKDLEGLQTMRNLARNMAFLIRAIRTEKEKSGLPEEEHAFFTSFPDGK